MFKLFSATIIFLGIYTSGVVQASPYATVREPTKAELIAGKSALEANLKDPDSLKMRKVLVGADEKNNPQIMCGEANAKNSYGGYVGYAGFLVHMGNENGKIDGMGSIDDPNSSARRDLCAQLGLLIQ